MCMYSQLYAVAYCHVAIKTWFELAYFVVLYRLYTLTECIWRELPVTTLSECDSTLLPRALNPREAKARRGRIDESITILANQNFGFFVSKF